METNTGIIASPYFHQSLMGNIPNPDTRKYKGAFNNNKFTNKDDEYWSYQLNDKNIGGIYSNLTENNKKNDLQIFVGTSDGTDPQTNEDEYEYPPHKA